MGVCRSLFSPPSLIMPNKKKAQEAKNKGNRFFGQKKYSDAISWYSKAIAHDNTDATFFSNRAASYMALTQLEQALQDSEMCITLKPDWVKGHYRKAMALIEMYRYEEAVMALKKGLEVDPGNSDLQSKLEEAEREAKYAPK